MNLFFATQNKHKLAEAQAVLGRQKTSDAAKKIKKMIGGSVDEIVPFLPGGGCEVRGG